MSFNQNVAIGELRDFITSLADALPKESGSAGAAMCLPVLIGRAEGIDLEKLIGLL